MNKCTYCGKEYPPGTTICPIDRHPVQESTLPPLTPQQQISSSIVDARAAADSEHLKLLSIFHFVLAGLGVLGMLFLVFHYVMMSTVFSNPDLWKAQKTPNPFPPEFFKIFIFFYIFTGAILALAVILNLLSGIFLRQRKHRVFCLVVSALNCLQIPFGTALGVFTFIVLLRPSVQKSYDTHI